MNPAIAEWNGIVNTSDCSGRSPHVECRWFSGCVLLGGLVRKAIARQEAC